MIDFAELDRLLRDSAIDMTLDNDEKLELRELGGSLGRDRVRYLRNRAFDLLRERWSQPDGAPLDLLRWLEQVVKTLDAAADPPAVEAQAYFAPGEDCLRKLRELCLGAKRVIDVCVYTISDDRLCDALVEAHRRGCAWKTAGRASRMARWHGWASAFFGYLARDKAAAAWAGPSCGASPASTTCACRWTAARRWVGCGCRSAGSGNQLLFI